MEHKNVNELRIIANNIRKKIIHSIYHAQTGHEGPSLSMVEILTLLYSKYLNINPLDPFDPNRDFLILSKGHGSPGLYAALAEFGLIPEEELLTLRRLGSRLQGHPNAEALPWVNFSTGSLGQGLSVGIGLALGFHLQNKINKVFCILGDGELQEGQNWEAAMSASALGISNLIAIIDRNKIQSDGFTENIMPLGDLESKWRSFGWNTYRIDGHDFIKLDNALTDAINYKEKPSIIIAETIKGKGISFMENSPQWHHFPLDEENYKKSLTELQE